MWRFRIFSVLFLSGFHLATSKLSLRYPNSQPDPTACQCVPPQDCLHGDFDLQNTCQNFGDVCCAPATISNAIRQPRSSDHSDSGQQNYENMGNSKAPTRANAVVLRKCGLRNSKGLDPSDTIQRTDEAKFGEFPWMTKVLHKYPPNEQGRVVQISRCGASLIHPKAVMTAGHCLIGISPHHIVIRAGKWDERNENEYLPHQDRDAQKIIVHEDFIFQRGGSYRNDYAIVIVESPFELAPHIGLVCLPDRMTAIDSLRCIATGWGRKAFTSGHDFPKILKKIALPMVPRDTCRNRITGLTMHPSFFCAGGVWGMDMCRGDSGGPFVCPLIDDPTRYFQVGIVGTGIRTCNKSYPGLYSNVTFAQEWILLTLAAIGLNNNDNTSVELPPMSSSYLPANMGLTSHRYPQCTVMKYEKDWEKRKLAKLPVTRSVHLLKFLVADANKL